MVDTIIRCGVLIDGLNATPTRDQSIAIHAGRIVSVSSTEDATSSTGAAAILDLSGFTCLPGLINTHVHFDGNPEDSVDYGVYARRTADETLRVILENAETTLLSGFTTVRHVGAWFPDAVYRARALIESGDELGPRIQTAGPYLTIPGGGGDLTFPEIPPENIPAESQQGIASSPEEFAARAEAAILAGADFLKVIASGAVFSVGTEPGAPEMTQIIEVLRRFCAYVIVDTPAYFNDVVLGMIEISDDVLLVAGMDIPNIKNVKIGLQTLRLLNTPMEKLRLILNRANSKVKLDVSEVERTLQVEADVLVPSDVIVPQSVNRGVPFVQGSPRSGVARSIEELADLFTTAEPAGKKKRWK